jgi:hypothetical protein
VVGVEEAECAQVLGGPVHRRRQSGVVGGHHRHGRPPRRQLPRRRGRLHRHAEAVAGLDVLTVDAGDHVEAERPPLLRRQVDLPPRQAAPGQRLVEGDGGRLRATVALGAEAEARLAELELAPATGGGAPLLDVEEVGEVDVELELHDDLPALRRVVAELDLLEEAAADVAGAEDGQGAVGSAGQRRGTAEEAGGEGLLPGQAEGLERRAVDPHLEAREEPGVVEEEPVGAAGAHVAVGAGEAERGPLDQGHGPLGAAEARHLAGVGPGLRHATGTVPEGIARLAPCGRLGRLPPWQQC